MSPAERRRYQRFETGDKTDIINLSQGGASVFFGPKKKLEIGDEITIDSERITTAINSVLIDTWNKEKMSVELLENRTAIPGIVKQVSMDGVVGVQFLNDITTHYTGMIGFFEETAKRKESTENKFTNDFENFLDSFGKKVLNLLRTAEEKIAKKSYIEALVLFQEIEFLLGELHYKPNNIKDIDSYIMKVLNIKIIGSVRHDLNNFLHIMFGFLDLIIKKNDKIESRTAIIKKETESMKLYIDKLGNLLSETNLNKIIEDIKKILIKNNKDITINFNTEAEEINKKFMFVVLYQLVENAINHGRSKNINISIEVQKHNVVIIVQDDGTGIDLDTIDVSVEEKKQKGLRVVLERDKTIKQEGGFGLYLVQYFIEEYHNGTIEILSNKNKGTMFKLIL